MKASELREMTRDEVVRRLAELKDEQFKLRLRRVTETLPNPVRLRLLRRDVARCQTLLAEMDRKARQAQAAEKAND
jgi:large subunit ribosomal protein L29